MFDILQYLPAKRKKSSSGWISFNAPCCVHNGESLDKRQRGGLKVADDSWSYHCFNCNYTASFLMGRNLSFKARRLLQWLNVPQDEIERINLESLRHRSIEGIANERRQITQRLMNIEFEERDLPDFAEILTPDKPLWSYIKKRCLPEDYPYMFQQHERIARHGIVVPFTHDNTVVGHTTRYIDGRTPKYIQEIQPGYVFNMDAQDWSRKFVIVTEGPFDALTISGISILGSEVNDTQRELINGLGRKVIVVPDRDAPGQKLVDQALEFGWNVAFPEWQKGVDDVADAVLQYGRLFVMQSILKTTESSKLKIDLKRKMYG